MQVAVSMLSTGGSVNEMSARYVEAMATHSQRVDRGPVRVLLFAVHSKLQKDGGGV